VQTKKSTSVHIKWCGELKFCFLLSNTIAYIKGKHIFLYEGWNFNSGNYLFTTDTK